MTGLEPCQVLNFPFLPAREIFPFTSPRMSKDKLYYGASLYHQVQSQGEEAEASEEKSLLGHSWRGRMVFLKIHLHKEVTMPFPFSLLCTPSWGQAGQEPLCICLLSTPSNSWQVQLRPGSPNISNKAKRNEWLVFAVPVTALVTLQSYDIIITSSEHSNFAVVWGKLTTVLIRGWCTRGPAAPLAPVHRMPSWQKRGCARAHPSHCHHVCIQPASTTKLIKLLSG